MIFVAVEEWYMKFVAGRMMLVPRKRERERVEASRRSFVAG